MHYPMMTERQVAARWKLSLKTLRRWRLDKEGPGFRIPTFLPSSFRTIW